MSEGNGKHGFTTSILHSDRASPIEHGAIIKPLQVSIAIAAVFTLGAGLLLAPLAVFFHDIVELVGVVLQILLFLTPIMYPMAILPERWLWIVRFNPVRSILEVFRDPIYYGKIPPASHLTVAALLAVALFALGAFAFSRTSRRITHYL